MFKSSLLKWLAMYKDQLRLEVRGLYSPPSTAATDGGVHVCTETGEDMGCSWHSGTCDAQGEVERGEFYLWKHLRRKYNE